MLQFQDDHVKVVHKNEKFGPEFSQILSRPNSCDKTSSAAGVDRLVSVSGSSDKIVEPDECSCKVKLCTNRSKETAAEARQSVLRREGYIKQILGSYGCYENNYKIVRTLKPVLEESSKKKAGKDGTYHFESEFWIKLCADRSQDIIIVQRLCEIRNVLIEKIGADMISMEDTPIFSHSEKLLQTIRSKMTSDAVFNARRTAYELVRMMSVEGKQPLKLANHGVPWSITEKNMTESPVVTTTDISKGGFSWTDMYRNSSLHFSAMYLCSFNVKSYTPKERNV